ncbi:XRE family transcriptional regulator [Pseudolabrys sp. Root1462]|jgi:transcriptional regulator with XRE-family HTH domain|uniref:helix-turn-helix domain-containing protein n=1 Tax=Pseudolabrys sp. Root1462 TaxID=1736466 RepID=UPI000703A7EC|nr:helix-turn-helix transcriptional regulator [Pseudolabrys sp. Root1462]KQY97171.1 XRE family transcriptional regulator [Pseudolabrys sp. Root1462]
MINKEQLRAARAWLNLSQQDLATAAKVGKRTIADFERGATIPHDRTLRDIEQTLIALGVEFQFEGQIGVGVRIYRSSTNS